MSKEIDQQDLQSAAKAFGCEDQLAREQVRSSLPPIKIDPSQNPLVARALNGSVSFHPDDPNSRSRSYAGWYAIDTRRRGVSSHVKEQDALGKMMTNKPNPR